MSKVFEIAFKLGAKLDPSVQKNFSAANKQLGNMGKSIGNAVKVGAKLAVGIGAAGIAAAGAATLMANKFADTADRIDKMSQSVGFSRQGFQEWDYILSQNGTSIDDMQTGIKTLTKRMDQAATGTGKGADAFNELKISATDSTGALKTQEEMFEESIKALQGMEEGTRKSQLAQDLFGSSSQDLMALLNQSADSVDNLKDKANDLGMVLGDNAVDAGILWADTMDTGKRAISGLFNVVAGSALPTMQKFLEYGISKLPMLQEKVSTAMSVAGNVIGWLGDKGMTTFNNIRNAIQDNQPTIQKLQDLAFELGGHIQGAFQAAQPYISWFANEGIPKAVNVLGGLLEGAINTYNFIKDNWSWIAPIVGGITGALIAYRAVTQSIILVKGALATAQIAWNVAMAANPIGLVVLGVAALIAIGIALWQNWDAISAWFSGMWRSFIGWVSPVGDAITNTFTSAYNAVTGLFGGIGNWFSGVMGSVTGAFKTGVNSVIKIANSAIGSLNGISVSIPDWVPKYGGQTFGVNIPKIPMLAQGGITTGATLAMIGEGAEQEAVLPLSKLQSLIGASSTSNKETNNNNSDQSIQIVYSPQYNIPEGANKSEIEQVAKQGYQEFKKWIKRYEDENKRLKFV